MVQSYNQVIYGSNNKWTIAILSNMDKSQKHIWKRSQKTYTVWFHLHKVQKQTKINNIFYRDTYKADKTIQKKKYANFMVVIYSGGKTHTGVSKILLISHFLSWIKGYRDVHYIIILWTAQKSFTHSFIYTSSQGKLLM